MDSLDDNDDDDDDDQQDRQTLPVTIGASRA